MGAHPGFRHGVGRLGATGASRISGCRESHSEGAVKGRLKLSDTERATLGEIGHRLGRKVLGEVANVARPDTILAWYRKLVARKFDGSKARRSTGRPPISREVELLIVRMAKENRDWGYDRDCGGVGQSGGTRSAIRRSAMSCNATACRHNGERLPAYRCPKSCPHQNLTTRVCFIGWLICSGNHRGTTTLGNRTHSHSHGASCGCYELQVHAPQSDGHSGSC